MHDRTAEQQEPGVRHAVPQTDIAAGEAGLLSCLSNWGLVCVCVWGVYTGCVCVCVYRVYVCVYTGCVGEGCVQGVWVCVNRVCVCCIQGVCTGECVCRGGCWYLHICMGVCMLVCMFTCLCMDVFGGGDV